MYYFSGVKKNDPVAFHYAGKIRVGKVREVTDSLIRLNCDDGKIKSFTKAKISNFKIIYPSVLWWTSRSEKMSTKFEQEIPDNTAVSVGGVLWYIVSFDSDVGDYWARDPDGGGNWIRPCDIDHVYES